MEQPLANNEITSNRIATELKEWKAREQRFEKLFSPDILKDRAFLKEKLGFYEHLQGKYGRSNAPEEKMMLVILARQQDLLRKEIYPNLWQRLLQRILAPIKQTRMARQEVVASGRNLAELKDSVTKVGFEGLDTKLEQHIRQGQKQFSIPLSYYVNEKQKMDFNLSFAKGADGNYRFEKYQASLIDSSSPNAAKQQVFNAADNVDSRQAQNLLAGRAIQQQSFDVSRGTTTKWIQLDFNDQDPSGNHKVKEFQKNYGFDLQKTLASLGLKESKSAPQQQQLIEALSRGERKQVTLIREGKEVKISIEANPQYKTLNVYDENEKKISLSQAMLGGKQQSLKATEQTAELSEQRSRRNGQSIRA